MENLIKYSDFLKEENSILEGKGISPIIYKDLKSYFDKTKSPNLEDANLHIKNSGKKWKLSKEDFEEAKLEFKK